jgi:hypothetical protein
MPYTIGTFASALGDLVGSLNAIAEELGQCDPGAEIDPTPGRTAICGGPVLVGGVCVAPERESFTVGDLVETVEGIRNWIEDVRARLGNYDPEIELDSGSWSSDLETTD